MKRSLFWIVVLCSSILVSWHAAAQPIYGQVSSKKVQVGVPFEFQVVVTLGGSVSPPGFKDLEVISGPVQSQNVQNVNGVVTQQFLLIYTLVARKEGKPMIGSAAVVSNGQKYESAPIVLEAVKGPATPDQSASKIGGSDLFIRTSVDKSKCFLGEQIVVVQKIYSRLQVVGFNKFEQPAYDGFYSQLQESTSRGVLQQENIDGIPYYTYELFRTAATANQVGKITLTPVEGDVVVRRQATGPGRAKSVWEQFFGATSYEDIPVTVRSKPMTVDVLPLPENGKPESFNGAVGNFQYKVQVTRNQLKANDALNLKMTVSGKGNIKLLTPPKLNLPEEFEVYDPKVSDSPNSKTFDYLVIPRNEGEYSLTGLDFSYFNLDTKKYVTVPAGEIKIKVLPPDSNSSGAQVYTSQSQVKQTENDIRYIKKGDFVLMKTETEFFNSPAHLALIGSPLLALLAVLIIRRKHIRNNSDLVQVRERKAAKQARQHLQNVEKLMNENKKDNFYTEILGALYKYLSYKLNIPVSDLSREKITLILAHKQVSESTISKLNTTLDTGEYAKYAPGAVSGDLQSVYKDTVELITSLEQQLNKKPA